MNGPKSLEQVKVSQPPHSAPTNTTSRGKVASNTAWNIGGQVVPLLVGILILPILIRKLGLERFGFVTLVWVLIGYASLFDFGISRAMTRTIAHRLANQDMKGAKHVANVGTNYLACFGIAVALLLAAAAPLLTERWMGLSAGLRDEALRAMYWLCASLPFVMLTAGYRGCLEAHQSFRVLNAIRAVFGVLTYVGPLAPLLFSDRLDHVVAFVVVLRVLANSAHAFACRRNCGFAFRPCIPDRATSRELFSLGGWIAVSNVVGPLLTYLDRLIIGGLVPMTSVAHYATPYDVIGKLLILPYALAAAVFPIASGMSPTSIGAATLYRDTVRALFVVIFPVSFAVIALARPALELWLGTDFAIHAAPVLQLLAVGLFFNTLAQAPALMIQAAGRPKWMAYLHLLELPPFLLLLWYLTERYGIIGTAWAAVARFALDAVALFALGRMRQETSFWRGRKLLASLAVVSCLVLAAILAEGTIQSCFVAIGGLIIFGIFSWHVIISQKERAKIRKRFLALWIV